MFARNFSNAPGVMTLDTVQFLLGVVFAMYAAHEMYRGRSPAWVGPAALFAYGLTALLASVGLERPVFEWTTTNGDFYEVHLDDPTALVLGIVALAFTWIHGRRWRMPGAILRRLWARSAVRRGTAVVLAAASLGGLFATTRASSPPLLLRHPHLWPLWLPPSLLAYKLWTAPTPFEPRAAGVLLLRSFRADEQRAAPRLALVEWGGLLFAVLLRQVPLLGSALVWLLRNEPWFQRPLVRLAQLGHTFERELVAALEARLGPTVSVGEPTDWLPPEGSRRVYLEQAAWVDEVRRMGDSARVVIYLLDHPTDGLLREIEIGWRWRAEGKTFAVVSYSRDAAVAEAWPDLATRVGERGVLLPHTFPGPGAALWIRADGVAVPITQGATSPEPLAAAIARVRASLPG